MLELKKQKNKTQSPAILASKVSPDLTQMQNINAVKDPHTLTGTLSCLLEPETLFISLLHFPRKQHTNNLHQRRQHLTLQTTEVKHYMSTVIIWPKTLLLRTMYRKNDFNISSEKNAQSFIYTCCIVTDLNNASFFSWTFPTKSWSDAPAWPMRLSLHFSCYWIVQQSEHI